MSNQLLEEQKFAARNFSRISKVIPRRLAIREDNISAQLAKAKTSPRRKLETLYTLMDELFQTVLPLTPCRNRCSSCCHYEVNITEIEIAHIEIHSKRKRSKVVGPKVNFHGTACPFLENGSCSIYEARPFTCRKHLALTKSNFWCDPVRSNLEKFPLIQFSGFENAFNLIRSESKSYDSVDIRQVFKRNATG
ncbi:YkgJ family cysteine cluster protein [Marinihelvus fidelis]|uniref:YkgJ family cysteine cluster protein n=1 Tax=Marinihelvus fidelis TaxID=2613842 RepID=A0A5N0T499_9GAMM|nr:YkgJ family cysteine cluster protein [Marinihelvus fidelis]KAA9129682.1 YkgJ family cysteine cluster protein [Marinihelvus fidelis]